MQLRHSETGLGRSVPGWRVYPDPGMAISLQDVLMLLNDEYDWIQTNKLSEFDLFLVFFVWKSKQFSNYGKQVVLLASQKQVYWMSRLLCLNCQGLPLLSDSLSIFEVLRIELFLVFAELTAVVNAALIDLVLGGSVSQILTMNTFS